MEESRPKMSSFYQRKLPESCIGFSSSQGKRIFASALKNGGLKCFFPLIEQFHTQTEPAFCGLSTLVLVLNALSVDPRQQWKGPWRWYEEQMLNCCLDLEDVKKTGITMTDFRCLAHCQGLSADLHFAEETSLDYFRKVVQRVCVETETDLDDGSAHSSLEVLVASYSRKTMGQTGSGHFSPIGAYDPTSDEVLILDTARFKYGAHWVQLPLLYEAMKPLDEASERSRGYLVLSFTPLVPSTDDAEHNNNVIQSISILFRARMSQSLARRQYKEFLSSLQSAVQWEQVTEYWTSTGNEIWQIVEPLRKVDFDPETREIVSDCRSFLREMIQKNPKNAGCCNEACISASEAMHIVYLASISDDNRREIVMDYSSSASTHVRERVLVEASLIARAIEISDETSLGEDVERKAAD